MKNDTIGPAKTSSHCVSSTTSRLTELGEKHISARQSRFTHLYMFTISYKISNLSMVYIRLGRKGVNFGNSLTVAGVCYMGSKDEDVVKYFGKKNYVYLCPT